MLHSNSADISIQSIEFSAIQRRYPKGTHAHSIHAASKRLLWIKKMPLWIKCMQKKIAPMKPWGAAWGSSWQSREERSPERPLPGTHSAMRQHRKPPTRRPAKAPANSDAPARSCSPATTWGSTSFHIMRIHPFMTPWNLRSKRWEERSHANLWWICCGTCRCSTDHVVDIGLDNFHYPEKWWSSSSVHTNGAHQIPLYMWYRVEGNQEFSSWSVLTSHQKGQSVTLAGQADAPHSPRPGSPEAALGRTIAFYWQWDSCHICKLVHCRQLPPHLKAVPGTIEMVQALCWSSPGPHFSLSLTAISASWCTADNCHHLWRQCMALQTWCKRFAGGGTHYKRSDCNPQKERGRRVGLKGDHPMRRVALPTLRLFAHILHRIHKLSRSSDSTSNPDLTYMVCTLLRWSGASTIMGHCGCHVSTVRRTYTLRGFGSDHRLNTQMKLHQDWYKSSDQHLFTTGFTTTSYILRLLVTRLWFPGCSIQACCYVRPLRYSGPGNVTMGNTALPDPTRLACWQDGLNHFGESICR